MNRKTTIQYFIKGAVAALMVLLLPVATMAASAVFDDTAANTWIMDNSTGKVIGSYTIPSGGPDGWTHEATQISGTRTRIRYNDTQTADIDDLDIGGTPPAQVVLVNETPASLPTVDPGLPQISLAGIASATSSVNGGVPAADISPESGDYDQTIAVRLKGIAGHALTGAVTLTWKVELNGVPDSELAGSVSPVEDPTEGFVHTIFLTKNGIYDIDFWVEQNNAESVHLLVNYTLNAALGVTRDTDNDGVPDLFEVKHGLNPLEDDYEQDTDGDGWTDFEEIIRGSDPTIAASTPPDSDGDGWSDFDEGLRGTNPSDIAQAVAAGYSDTPLVRRIHEVEYLVNGAIYEDIAETIKKTTMGDLTARDLYWTPHYDQSQLPTTAELAALGITPAQIPLRLREAYVAAQLSAGDLPELRLPAGDPMILRTGSQTPGDEAWIAKAWLDKSPDLHPAEVTDWLIGQGSSWTTADEWETAYSGAQGYLIANIKTDVTINLSPGSGLGIALVEGVMAWYANLSDGAQILLGYDGTTPPGDALSNMSDAIRRKGLTWNQMHSDLLMLTSGGNELAPFAAEVLGYYGDLTTLPTLVITTTRGAAALVQGGHKNPLYDYIARVTSLLKLSAIDALNPADRALLLDPTQDYDGDGIGNGDELNQPPNQATNPDDLDSDNDLLPDSIDPCSADLDNTCLDLLHQEDNTDGDGIRDAIDNCMHVSNPLQTDSNADGVGDDCLFYANIKTPASNVTLWVGGSVSFSSLITELGTGLTLDYEWSFDGGAADSTEANPGMVQFNTPGDYTVKLRVIDTANPTEPVGSDKRMVHVIGSGPVVDAGGPYEVTEGQNLTLTATATSDVGELGAFEWLFGDSESGTGNPIDHFYVANGDYIAEVTVRDGAGIPGMDQANVTVLDSVPTADFQATPEEGVAPLTVNFMDTSTAYDGVMSWDWDFGDGSPGSSVQDPSHIYSARGVYQAELTVTDGDFSDDTAMSDIRVWSGFILLADGDGDLLPDNYEGSATGTNPSVDDASDDQEPDDFSNLIEYRAQTDPTDAGDYPQEISPGLMPVLIDDFEDGTFADRWSIGLESPLAVHNQAETGGVLQFSLVAPFGEICSEASMISFPTASAESLEIRLDMTLSGPGEACISLVKDMDLNHTVEVCGSWNGMDYDVSIHTMKNGVPDTVPGVSTIPAATGVLWRLLKNGDTYLLYTDVAGEPLPILQGVVTNSAMGNADLRPLLKLSNCDSASVEMDVDSLQVLELTADPCSPLVWVTQPAPSVPPQFLPQFDILAETMDVCLEVQVSVNGQVGCIDCTPPEEPPMCLDPDPEAFEQLTFAIQDLITLSSIELGTTVDCNGSSQEAMICGPFVMCTELDPGSYEVMAAHAQQGPGAEEQDVGLILLNVYRANPLEFTADFNGSGAVDGSDLAILADNPALLDLSEFALQFGRFYPDLVIFENP